MLKLGDSLLGKQPLKARPRVWINDFWIVLKRLGMQLIDLLNHLGRTGIEIKLWKKDLWRTGLFKGRSILMTKTNRNKKKWKKGVRLLRFYSQETGCRNILFPDWVVANVCYHPSKRKNYPKAELEVSWVRGLSHRGKRQSRGPKGQIFTSQWTILMHWNLMESALLGLELSWNGWSFNYWHFFPLLGWQYL